MSKQVSAERLVKKNSFGFIWENVNRKPINLSKIEYIFLSKNDNYYHINFKLGFDRDITWSFKTEDERTKVFNDMMEC